MITKSVAQFLKLAPSHLYEAKPLTQVSQRYFAGGGKKKKSMPPTETNFDLVVVGTFIQILIHYVYRWP